MWLKLCDAEKREKRRNSRNVICKCFDREEEREREKDTYIYIELFIYSFTSLAENWYDLHIIDVTEAEGKKENES